jgi:enamine deaminase RidA (YjgF/YER057c/UK114 family)
MNVETRLAKLGLALPKPTKPVGNYQPWILSGNLLYLSGQFPIQDGKLIYTGRVGAERTEADGYAAARLASLNVLAQIHAALGGFDRLKTLLRVEGHIASAPGLEQCAESVGRRIGLVCNGAARMRPTHTHSVHAAATAAQFDP